MKKKVSMSEDKEREGGKMDVQHEAGRKKYQ